MDAMQDTGQPSALQLLFIELGVGLARSGEPPSKWRAAVALLPFLPNVVTSPAESALPVDLVLLKWAFAIFGLGLFIAAITFVNAFVAQGAIASGRSSAFGNAMRRLGLGLIAVSPASFPHRACPCGGGDLT
jgi:hypothetical protein